MCRERKLYTAAADPYCRFIKQYFNENSIHYKEVDISRNKAEFYELLNFYGTGPLPVLVEDGKIIPVHQILQNVQMSFSGIAARQ
jgi:glutaredoxin